MPSKIYYKCGQCQQETPSGHLSDALHDLSKGVVSNCTACGGTKQVHKIFDFSLEAGSAECKLLHAFLPSNLDSWQKENGNWITFYPFLVVMEHTSKEGRVFWLPYWHIEEGRGTKRRKYGQFASFLEEPGLKSLLAQAREKGYLRELA